MLHGVLLFHGVWSCASDVYCGGRCLQRGKEGKGKGNGKVVSPDGIGMAFIVPRAAMRVDDLIGRLLT